MSTTREQGYPSNVSISDNSYCDPSYNPRQTKVTKQPYVWDGVTRRDKSRIDPALKPLISENHKTYTTLKAHPYEWQEMLNSLDIFEPNRWLSEKPICWLLMDMWWPLRYSPNTCLAYLPFTVLQDMSIKVSRQGRGNPDNCHRASFSNFCFSLFLIPFLIILFPSYFNSINDKALQSNWGLLNKTSALSGDNGTDSTVKGDTPHSCGLLCRCSRASSTTHRSCLIQ